MEKIYIVPIDGYKPVKIVLEGNSISEYTTRKYRKRPQEVLRDELKYNYNLRKQLTRQQIHSEYGKLKSGNYKEVINFLLKRGVTTSELNRKLNEIHEDIIMQVETKIDTSTINGKFGIYEVI